MINPNAYVIALVFLASYFIGAIPFGVLAGKINGVDVRSVGSGNIGTTNVWRALGPIWGISVFLLDMGKGVAGPLLATFILGYSFKEYVALCALLAVFGHVFSIFLKFKGGKGIATGLGAMLGLWWPGALAAFSIWIIFFVISRMVSLASIIACIFLPILTWSLHEPPAFALVITLFCMVAIIKHIPNMKRIAAGTESRVSFGHKKITKEVPRNS